MNDAIRMQLSAFVDGELSEAEAGLLIRRISRDPELRALAAEYQEIGRLMRAEESPVGTGRLLSRIHAELDDESLPDLPAVQPATSRRFRPLAGVAAAAAVAVLAVFGASNLYAPELETSAYTVPDAADEVYFERHSQSANSFNARVVSYELQSDDLESDEETDDDAATDSEPATE